MTPTPDDIRQALDVLEHFGLLVVDTFAQSELRSFHDAVELAEAFICDAANRDVVLAAMGVGVRLVRDAVDELDDEHRPQWATDKAKADGKDPIGCVMCFPADGSWPCVTRMIADDLRRLADPREDQR